MAQDDVSCLTDPLRLAVVAGGAELASRPAVPRLAVAADQRAVAAQLTTHREAANITLDQLSEHLLGK